MEADAGPDAPAPYPDRPVNSSPYLCDEDGGTVWYEPSLETFAPPDREGGGPTTRDEWIEEFNGQLPESAKSISAAPELEPGGRVPQTLFAELDQDVRLHLTTVHPRDHYERARLAVSVLVNYEPVQAVFEHYTPNRERVRKIEQGEGVYWPITGDVEVVDIVIPPDAFARPGMYDIALFNTVAVPGRDTLAIRRFRLYRGDYRRQPHECLRVGEIRDMTPRENEIRQFALQLQALLYLPDKTPTELQGPLSAEPGETVQVDYALLPVDDEVVRPFALVPFLNGQPLDWREFVVAPGGESWADPGEVAHRGQFEVTLPGEPGVYNLMLAAWPYPFLEGGEVVGAGVGEVPGRMPRGLGSTVLHFVVE